MEYNLDIDEQIDTLSLYWKEYEIWDIPLEICQDIVDIDTTKNTKQQWIPIIESILKLRNELNIDLWKISDDKLTKIIQLISLKVSKWKIW